MSTERQLVPSRNLLRGTKILVMYAIVALLGSMAASGCKHMLTALAFIVVSSFLVPTILLATGQLKMPLIHGISYVGSIGLLLFGGIAIVFGMFGQITDAGFWRTPAAALTWPQKLPSRLSGTQPKCFEYI